MKYLKLFEDYEHYYSKDDEKSNDLDFEEDLRSLVAGRNTHDTGRPSNIDYTKKTEFRPEHDLGDVVRGRMEEDEFDYEKDEFDYEKDGVKYGKKYLNEPPSEIHVEGKKSKPDFLDLDKDGNKKESMKKAAKDAKDKKEDKKDNKKGLSAAQKKLPAGLQAAIARKAAKKNPKD
jgi:hypothetical protein